MSSKVLYLWSVAQQGFIDTHVEAQAIFIRLMDEQDTPSALAEPTPQQTTWVMAFAEHLQQAAQNKQNIPLESRQPFMHSSKGLAKYAQNHLLVLELPNLPEAIFLPMLLEIIEIAKNLNLVIFDDEKLGIYFLPSGDILPTEKEDLWLGYIEYWESQRDTTFNNLAELKNYIEPLIKNLMNDKGFLLNYKETIEKKYEEYMYDYTKETPIGPYCISFYLGITKYGYKLSVRLSIYLKLPDFDYSKVPFIDKKSEIINNFKGLPVGYPIISFIPKEKSSTLSRNLTHIKNIANVQAAMLDIKNILFSLFPLLSGHIQNLVLIMKESYYFRDDYYKKYGDIYDSIPYLFAFHLASDSKFEVLVNDFKVSIKDSSKPLLEDEFLAFVKFLREEIKPLV
ncbi:hypothetical protein FK216_07655 [Moraxellaceae bacterium AER2_44_116]|nr:hypothetical protein [Moraxellaceae bacterium]TQC98155.1 hypothetical protein FK216_07655 [Moraxellaceae bacterium AER2_44_116]